MEVSTYTIGWGTLAMINANIAQLKGKSAMICFLLSLLIGPIMTFILLIYKTKEV